MIYRFLTRQVGSGRTLEIQVQAPVGTPIDKIGQAFRTQFSRQGIQVESLQYVGSIDTDFEGIILPVAEKCATPGCERTVETPGAYCEECRKATIDGWYNPIGDAPANNVCTVHGCGQVSTFHLCKKHAVPGMVVEALNNKGVVSIWLVEREGQMRLITLNDLALGDVFGGREFLEKRLHEQGYKIPTTTLRKTVPATSLRSPAIGAIPTARSTCGRIGNPCGGSIMLRRRSSTNPPRSICGRQSRTCGSGVCGN